MNFVSLKKAWALLDAQERHTSLKVLAVMVIGAVAAALMVGYVYPFLAVLSNPDLITDTPVLAWAYKTGGFTSEYNFLFALGMGAIVCVIWDLSRIGAMRRAQPRIDSNREK
jgi:hypothetical protein